MTKRGNLAKKYGDHDHDERQLDALGTLRGPPTTNQIPFSPFE